MSGGVWRGIRQAHPERAGQAVASVRQAHRERFSLFDLPNPFGVSLSNPCLTLALSLCLCTAAFAQDEPDFELEDAPASAWSPLVELFLRGDHVSGLPNNREDLERVKAKLRVGALWQGETLSFGIAGEAGQGSDDNADNLINNDVEKSDGAGLDQLWLRWQANEHASVQAGKAPIPLDLTPLLWDDDLRPVGASARFGASVGETHRWQLDVGGFEPDPLGERSANLGAVQLGWHWREGTPLGFGLLLGYLEWSDLDGYARAGLGRGNSVAAGRYLNDYRLLDAQAYVRGRVFERPLELRIDRVHNLDAAANDDGTRASLVLGNRFEGGWEFGWAWQRIQRDAVVAAVNADDWWFHTAARGNMPWVGYGFDGGTWSLRLAAFVETRDGLQEDTERVLLDVAARW
jgi:hypothetical protein